MKKRCRFVTVLFVSVAVFVLHSCSLPGLPAKNQVNVITVGSTSTSESQILAAIVKEMIAYYEGDLEVLIVGNLGSSRIMHQAMLRGDVTVAASRYTGSDLTGSLSLPAESNPEKALALVQAGFHKEFQLKWYPSYGFDNTYAFMVSQEVAQRYNLEKISDLAPWAETLRVGIDTVWLNRLGDGYDGFQAAYGIEFARIFPMQIGLVYEAINAGKMDMALGYSSDGRIASYNLVTLVDDLHFFPAYDCSIVASEKLLAQHPGLDAIFLKLVGQIDTPTMRRLNYEVDDQLLDPEFVAKRFLQSHHYFEQAE